MFFILLLSFISVIFIQIILIEPLKEEETLLLFYEQTKAYFYIVQEKYETIACSYILLLKK